MPEKISSRLRSGSLQDELIALVALVRAHAFRGEQLIAATEYYGSAVELLQAALQGEPVVRDQSLFGVTEEHLSRAATEVSEWERRGLVVRSMLDPEYPANLQNIYNKPPWLFLSGQWDEFLHSKAVAVVGTRRATPEGIQRARKLAKELVEAGYTVFSGMARGIDTAAHLATLQANGSTVAVMGTGILRRYPKENSELAEAIVQSRGVLVSSFLPDQPPTKWTFPVRNIVMSGMCLATVVVEAGPTSGARMQAQAALYHGRSVFLPSSLVAGYEWARKCVEVGFHGVRAVEVASTGDIVRYLQLDPQLAPPLVA